MRDSLDEAITRAIEAFNTLSIEEQRAQMRAQVISFAYWNLALSGSRATKEDVARAYDRIHGAEL